jgi:hypothetical protein
MRTLTWQHLNRAVLARYDGRTGATVWGPVALGGTGDRAWMVDDGGSLFTPGAEVKGYYNFPVRQYFLTTGANTYVAAGSLAVVAVCVAIRAIGGRFYISMSLIRLLLPVSLSDEAIANLLYLTNDGVPGFTATR